MRIEWIDYQDKTHTSIDLTLEKINTLSAMVLFVNAFVGLAAEWLTNQKADINRCPIKRCRCHYAEKVIWPFWLNLTSVKSVKSITGGSRAGVAASDVGQDLCVVSIFPLESWWQVCLYFIGLSDFTSTGWYWVSSALLLETLNFFIDKKATIIIQMSRGLLSCQNEHTAERLKL